MLNLNGQRTIVNCSLRLIFNFIGHAMVFVKTSSWSFSSSSSVKFQYKFLGKRPYSGGHVEDTTKSLFVHHHHPPALPYKSQKPTWSGLHKHLTFYVTPRRTTSALPNKLLHQKVHHGAHCTVCVDCGSARQASCVCRMVASAKMVE